MEGCIELTGSTPNTTYFMKDSKIVAKRVITVAVDGGTVERWYKDDGKLHRDGDLPAEIHYSESGQKCSEYWYKDGERHRIDLPDKICYYENGQKSSEQWYKDGELHRDGDLPALIYYYKTGQKRCEYWYKNGKRHRDGDLPAEIRYYKNSQKSDEYWYKGDNRHRDGGKPAGVHYPKHQAPIVSTAPSVEDRLVKLEAIMAKLATAFTEKQ